MHGSDDGALAGKRLSLILGIIVFICVFSCVYTVAVASASSAARKPPNEPRPYSWHLLLTTEGHTVEEGACETVRARHRSPGWGVVTMVAPGAGPSPRPVWDVLCPPSLRWEPLAGTQPCLCGVETVWTIPGPEPHGGLCVNFKILVGRWGIPSTCTPKTSLGKQLTCTRGPLPANLERLPLSVSQGPPCTGASL